MLGVDYARILPIRSLISSPSRLSTKSGSKLSVFVGRIKIPGPAVAPFVQMMHGLSTLGAEEDDIFVVARVVSSTGNGVGAGVS
jgi:hypothetical protein